jgi:hypothetical protein
MAAEFVAGVAVGVVFKDRIVAGVLNVTNFPARAWAGFKAAIGVKVASVESSLHDDIIALQAKVDKAFGKGQVITSALQSSTMGNTTVENCMVQAVKRWPFPAPEGGGLVLVSYPFVLAPAGG